MVKQPALDELEKGESSPDAESPAEDKNESGGEKFLGMSKEYMDEAARLRPTERTVWPNIPAQLKLMIAAAYNFDVLDMAGETDLATPEIMKQVAQVKEMMLQSRAGTHESPEPSEQGIPAVPEDVAGGGGPMGGPPAGPPGPMG